MRFKVNPLDPTGLSPVEETVIVSTGGGGGGGPSTSIGVTGEPQLTGEVTLTAGANVTLTQTGQDIEIESTASGLPAGGTEGQILAKNSNTDFDVEWIDNFASSTRHLVKAAEAITKGMAVYVSGANGTNMLVSKASNDSEEKSSKVLGLSQSTLATNDQGYVVTEGLIANIDTSAAGTEGDPVWLGTNGNLLYGTANKPVAPANLVYIGVVTRKSATVGEIFVNVSNGYELDELHNVLISSLADKNILYYDNATSLWKNASVATALGYTPENVANKSTNTALGTSDTLYPTQNAVKTYTDNILGNANALIYKGVIDCSANPNYPAADAGWLYVVSVAGKIGGASGVEVEVGDMAICNTDGTASGDQATVGTKWNVIQKNIVGAVTGPASSVNNNVAFFDGTTGKVIKDGGITLSGSNTGDETQSTIKTKLGAASTSTDGYLTSADWNTFNGKQAALGYTPENVGNKKTTLADNSDTFYPSQKAVKTAVDAKYGSGDSPSFGTITTTGTIELGNASDTTIARVGAGQISVEGVNVVTTSSTDTLTNKTLSTGSTIDANVTVTEVLKKVYPVGSIYTATVSTNPATLFGFGTWSAYGAGRVLVGKASSGTFATAGATGGAETVTLTAAQSGLPAHTHTVASVLMNVADPKSFASGTFAGQNATATSAANTAQNASEAHTNLQPYIVVYMWERTA